MRILALPDQPTLLQGSKDEYYFLQTVALKLGKDKLAGRHHAQWTVDQQRNLLEAFQSGFDELAHSLRLADTQGKSLYVKEHVPWLSDPTAETRFIFGEDSTDDRPWTVDAPDATRSPGNETILPDAFLKQWLPTFLIRHPALTFPSLYRTGLAQGAGVESYLAPEQAVEMTLHWTRSLYDWYVKRLETAVASLGKEAIKWPTVLDADDIMTQPGMIDQYCEMIGLDALKCKFEWDVASEDQMEEMPGVRKRMLKTLLSSHGVVRGKTSVGLDLDAECEKWKEEFAEGAAAKMMEWVTAALPDYEYLKAQRLRMDA